MNEIWSWDRAAQVFPELLEGLRVTVLATAEWARRWPIEEVWRARKTG